MSFFPLTGKGPKSGELKLWYLKRYEYPVTGVFEGPERIPLNKTAKEMHGYFHKKHISPNQKI